MQAVMDILRNTNLGEMKDAAIVDWIGDVDKWLFEQYASSTEMRLLVIGVLCTVPWWRYTAEKALRSRRVAKLVSNLERVCVALVMHSPLGAERVLEVVLRPFTCPILATPLERIHHAATGGRLAQEPFVPKELASRVLNVIAVRWPEMVSELIRRCVETMYPPRRWPYVAHHLAYAEMLLQLALESHVPNRAAPNRTPGGPRSTSDSETTVTSAGLSSHEDFSDTSSTRHPLNFNASVASALQGPNNRLLSYREELIRLILRKLLEMEQNVEQASAGDEDEEDPMCAVIRATCECVYTRLADDLRRQQDAGSCGNAEWWKEIITFHLRDVALLPRVPCAVQYLAPALSRLGSNGEAADLIHKTISLVTKKGSSRPAVASLRSTGRLSSSSSFISMGPPAPATAPLTTEARSLVASHIYPLFQFLLPVLDDDVKEGVQRRMFKWLKEVTTAGSSAPSPSWGSSSAMLVDSVFAQCVGICNILGVKMDRATDIPPDQLEAMTSKFGASHRRSSGGSSSVLSASANALYGACPWSLRSLDGNASRMGMIDDEPSDEDVKAS